MPYRTIVLITFVCLLCLNFHCGKEANCDYQNSSGISCSVDIIPSETEYKIGDTINLKSTFTSFKELDNGEGFVQVSQADIVIGFLKFYPHTNNTRGALENFDLLYNEGFLVIDSSQLGSNSIVYLNCDSAFCRFEYKAVPKDTGLYFLFSLGGHFVDSTLLEDICYRQEGITPYYNNNNSNLALFDSLGIETFDANPFNSNLGYHEYEVDKCRTLLFPFRVVN